jgi:hypothetical protein
MLQLLLNVIRICFASGSIRCLLFRAPPRWALAVSQRRLPHGPMGGRAANARVATALSRGSNVTGLETGAFADLSLGSWRLICDNNPENPCTPRQPRSANSPHDSLLRIQLPRPAVPEALFVLPTHATSATTQPATPHARLIRSLFMAMSPSGDNPSVRRISLASTATTKLHSIL